jgi:hypothetical protein
MQLTDVGTKDLQSSMKGQRILRGHVLEQLMARNSSDQGDEVRFNLSPILMVQSDLCPFI